MILVRWVWRWLVWVWWWLVWVWWWWLVWWWWVWWWVMMMLMASPTSECAVSGAERQNMLINDPPHTTALRCTDMHWYTYKYKIKIHPKIFQLMIHLTPLHCVALIYAVQYYIQGALYTFHNHISHHCTKWCTALQWYTYKVQCTIHCTALHYVVQCMVQNTSSSQRVSFIPSYRSAMQCNDLLIYNSLTIPAVI